MKEKIVFGILLAMAPLFAYIQVECLGKQSL